MKKEFVTYEQALALKELGFDEACFAKYTSNRLLLSINWSNVWCENINESEIYAPLKQQAIKFLLNMCDNLHDGELSIEYFSDESGILNNYGLPFKSILEAIDKLIGLANDKIV
jgi:hypothetical protein